MLYNINKKEGVEVMNVMKEKEYSRFKSSINSLNTGIHTFKEIATIILFNYYIQRSQRIYDTYSSIKNEVNGIFSEIPKLIVIKESLEELNLTNEIISNWIKEISLTEELDSHSIFVNNEFYKLICMILDIKSSDVVYDVNLINERFLFNAYEYVEKQDKSILRLRTMYKSEYNFASNISEIRFIMNNMNYFKVSDLQVNKMKATKIFINPSYNILERNFKNLKSSNNQWIEINKLIDGLSEGEKIVAAIPDNMLFKNTDKEYRKKLLEKKLIEGLISIPLRLFSPNSNVNITLLVLSKGNHVIKILNAANIFNNDDMKNAGLEKVADLISERYHDDDVEYINSDVLISRGSILSLQNIVTKKIYTNLENLIKLTEVATVFKGYKGTAANFREIETESTASNYYVLTSSDIQDGTIKYDSMMKIIDGKKYEKYLLEDGDLVLTTKSTKIKIAVANSFRNKKVIVSGSMFIIRPNPKKINSLYLKMFLESDKGKIILESIQKGNFITTITLDDLKEILIPCPKLEIQDEKAMAYKILQEQYIEKKKELEELKEEITSLFDSFI